MFHYFNAPSVSLLITTVSIFTQSAAVVENDGTITPFTEIRSQAEYIDASILYPGEPLNICNLTPILEKQFQLNQDNFFLRITTVFRQLPLEMLYKLPSYCKPYLWAGGKMYLPDQYSGFHLESSLSDFSRTFTVFSNRLPASENLELITPKFCMKKLAIAHSVEVFTQPEQVFNILERFPEFAELLRNKLWLFINCVVMLVLQTVEASSRIQTLFNFSFFKANLFFFNLIFSTTVSFKIQEELILIFFHLDLRVNKLTWC